MNNKHDKPTLISLFSGAGGLDLGFHQAGFHTTWANEYDNAIAPSFQNHFPDVKLDTRSIVKIPEAEIPLADGVLEVPPANLGVKQEHDEA